jgi:hypothetical protein
LLSKTFEMKKNKITQTILTGAVVMLGATSSAQTTPAASGEIRPFKVH